MGFDYHRFDLLIGAAKDIAAAIREQTEYFREDDQKDEDTVDTEAVEDTMPRPSFSRPSTHGSGLAVDVNTMRQRRDDINAEWRRRLRADPPVVSDEAQIILQETPHQFYERGTRMGFLSDRRCHLCNLRFRNPVHLIQMAQLPTED